MEIFKCRLLDLVVSLSSIVSLQLFFVCLFYLFICLFVYSHKNTSHTCLIVVLGDPNEIDVHRRICRVKSRDFL